MAKLLNFDIVGSFLRPAALKEARAQFAAGHLTQAQLTAVEDEQIKTLVDHELAAGLQAVTDGEFRRSYWHLDTFWGFAGIAHIKTKRGYLFHAEETRNDSAIVTGKIKFTGTHPDLAAFKFLNNLVKDKPNVHARQSIPAPAQLYSELVRTPKHIEALRQVYATDAELLHDIAQAYHDLILALYDAGCRDLKFDDCTWGMVVDQKFFATINGSKDQQEQTITNYLTVNNLALANLPEDLRVPTHVCRGTTTQRGRPLVVTVLSVITYSLGKTLVPFIWNLMTTALVTLRHWLRCPLEKTWCWASLPASTLNWKVQPPSSAASKKLASTCRWTTWH